MKKESILLVPSRVASHRADHGFICEIAAQTFGEARCFVPEGEYEKGWPGSCNFMMKSALEHIEKHFDDDMFLLEPDAIPLCPTWYQQIRKEWDHRWRDEEFMGRLVHYQGHPPHMTGIGVYGRNWRSVAPKLAEVQDAKGWDTYAAAEILPKAVITKLIQHIWWNPQVSLELLEEGAVVFHQDKAGKLIGLLDQRFSGGKADKYWGYSQVGKAALILPMRQFFTSNANRKIKAPGFDFIFDKTEMIGGVWEGVYATQDEAEIASLLSAVADPSIGVTEISLDEYERLAKKKLIPRVASVVTAPAPPQVQINQSPAVLVEDPEPSVEKGEDKPPESIDEVLKVETVTMLDQPVNLRRIAKDVEKLSTGKFPRRKRK